MPVYLALCVCVCGGVCFFTCGDGVTGYDSCQAAVSTGNGYCRQ